MPCPLNTSPVISYALFGDGQVTLFWESVSGANAYRIKYGISTGVYTEEIDTSNVTTYTVTGLTNGTIYYFVISALSDQANTYFEDDSPSNHTITNQHNVTVDTSIKKLGNGSGNFSGGSSDYLTCADSPDWQLGGGSGNFTVEFFVYFDADMTLGSPDYSSMSIINQFLDDNYFWSLHYTRGDTNCFEFQCRESGGVIIDIIRVNSFIPIIDTWYHIALVRNGNNFQFYVNGSAVGAVTTDSDSIPNFNGTLQIGHGCRGGGATIVNIPDLKGKLDELRISNIARYTSGFTPTTDEFEPDANTVLLIHFNLEKCESPDSEEISVEGIDVVCGQVGVAISSLANLDHLEGETVAILANGVVLAQQIVTDGEITLNSTYYSKVHVGLPYMSDFSTLNIEIGLQDGTAQGRKVKIGHVTFRVIDTVGGWIGGDEDNLYNAFPNAIEQLLGYVPDMFDGDIRMVLGDGYADGGKLFYRNYDPTSVQINAVIPEVSIGGASG